MSESSVSPLRGASLPPSEGSAPSEASLTPLKFSLPEESPSLAPKDFSQSFVELGIKRSPISSHTYTKVEAALTPWADLVEKLAKT